MPWTEMETVVGGTGLWGKDQEFCLGCVIRHTRFGVAYKTSQGRAGMGTWTLEPRFLSERPKLDL